MAKTYYANHGTQGFVPIENAKPFKSSIEGYEFCISKTLSTRYPVYTITEVTSGFRVVSSYWRSEAISNFREIEESEELLAKFKTNVALAIEKWGASPYEK